MVPFVLPALLAVPATAATTTIDFSGATPLGKWTGFYRGTQLQGNGLAGHEGLVTVPPILFQGSFPYQKRAYPREVLFADTLSFVRFVGGWNKALLWGEDGGTDQGDLAYRRPDGSVGYRWEKIWPRIDPYLQAGYRDLIISLDNVPWQLAERGSTGIYGQNAPARDLKEWDAFMRAFFTQLRDHYGLEVVRGWKFRMGTEPNGGVTFAGTHEQFVAMYAVTARALHEVIPGAMFSPGEFAGGLVPGHPSKAFDYLTFAASQAALASPTLPFDYIGNSAHAIPRWVGRRLVGGIDPRERVQGTETSLDHLRQAWPALRSDPFYIFQFGILGSEVPDPDHPATMVSTSEPGGRGAAWTFDTILGFKEHEPHLAGIWHWDVGDPLSFKEGAGFLLFGNGWLYDIFDQFREGTAWSTPTQEIAPGRLLKALFATKAGTGYLLLSNFSPDRRQAQPEDVQVKLPAAIIGAIPLKFPRQLVLSEANAPLRQVKDALGAAGLLKPAYAKTPVVASIRDMAGTPGLQFVTQHLQEFQAAEIDSLTLKSFAGKVVSGADGATTVTCTLPPDSVTLVAFGPK